MTDLLDDVAFQLGIWSYAIAGDVCEFSATLAERQLLPDRAWDHHGRRSGTLTHAGSTVAVPAWWSLPWLTEHVTRGHAAYEPAW